jgi:tripartite-type tricarboxylate transporter receptor subunit TctC
LAQPYPNRTVTIIVPYSAGGPVDQLARVAANALSAKLKQNFVVENVTGGSTITGTNRVAHAAPDGYTLLVHNLQISANATLYKNLPFDTEKDLAPVMFIYRNPLVLVGRKTLSANSLEELTALMKKQRMKSAIRDSAPLAISPQRYWYRKPRFLSTSFHTAAARQC